MLLSREDKDLGVASHAPPGSQASPRGESKDFALLPSRDGDILVPPELMRYDGELRETPVVPRKSGLHARGEGERVHTHTHTSQPLFHTAHLSSQGPPWSPYICSLCLCLYYRFANKTISTIFILCGRCTGVAVPLRKLNAEELMLLNCGVGEDS